MFSFDLPDDLFKPGEAKPTKLKKKPPVKGVTNGDAALLKKRKLEEQGEVCLFIINCALRCF